MENNTINRPLRLLHCGLLLCTLLTACTPYRRAFVLRSHLKTALNPQYWTVNLARYNQVEVQYKDSIDCTLYLYRREGFDNEVTVDTYAREEVYFLHITFKGPQYDEERYLSEMSERHTRFQKDNPKALPQTIEVAYSLDEAVTLEDRFHEFSILQGYLSVEDAPFIRESYRLHQLVLDHLQRPTALEEWEQVRCNTVGSSLRPQR